jgi:nitrate/nitrite transport system ATP-binding protein
MNEAHVELVDVTKTFTTAAGGYVAVQNVSFEIGRGEVVALVGHSGCGKSTLVNLVAGLSAPTHGEIRLRGQAIAGPGPDRAMVFQNYSLLPWLTVWSNIFEAVDSVLVGKSKAEKREQVERFLRVVGLWDHRDKRPGQLSGGMKQRVAIARAFAVHPEVLLLDEPFGALDALTRGALQEELINLWSLDNATETVILVTHDIEEAILLSDRVVVMTNGPAATIREIVDIDIPRPRSKREIAHLPAYVEARDRLLDLLATSHALFAA